MADVSAEASVSETVNAAAGDDGDELDEDGDDTRCRCWHAKRIAALAVGVTSRPSRVPQCQV